MYVWNIFFIHMNASFYRSILYLETKFNFKSNKEIKWYLNHQSQILSFLNDLTCDKDVDMTNIMQSIYFSKVAKTPLKIYSSN